MIDAYGNLQIAAKYEAQSAPPWQSANTPLIEGD
jgi:hypothetical protein